MRVSAFSSRPAVRIAIAGLIVAGIAAGSGCSWFRKGNKLYAGDPASRPLEVPPELDAAQTSAASGPVLASQRRAAPAAAATTGSVVGFTLAGTRDAAFAKVGEVLATVPGLTIASQAQMLGAYDVNIDGSNFLVRVSEVEAGAYVSAVDPRGVPAAGEAPKKVMDALKAALAVP